MESYHNPMVAQHDRTGQDSSIRTSFIPALAEGREESVCLFVFEITRCTCDNVWWFRSKFGVAKDGLGIFLKKLTPPPKRPRPRQEGVYVCITRIFFWRRERFLRDRGEWYCVVSSSRSSIWTRIPLLPISSHYLILAFDSKGIPCCIFVLAFLQV